MAKKFVRLDNMAATRIGSLIKSAKYFATGDNEAAVENGELVTVGDLLDGEREVHKATTPADGDEMIGLVCTPEVEYDTRGYHDIDTFSNAAGDEIRVMILHKGDCFSVANEGTGADKKVGETVVAKFVRTEVSGRFTYNVYEV